MKTEVTIDRPLKPKGPYSLGIIGRGELLFVSGVGPVDLETQEFITDSFEEQASLTLDHLKSVIEAAGAHLADVVKVNVYLSDMKDFPTLNSLYSRYFPKPYPARTTIQSNLLGFLIAVDAIVCMPE